MEALLTKEQERRYQRQLAIPEIGPEGQIKLGKASVMIAGLGGLGSISSYYLAAAGVGRLRIVDRDHVEMENLNRQLLHHTLDVGRRKVESAVIKLHSLNSGCLVEPLHAHIGEENALELAQGCDLILDATDNLATRHVLNRISLIRQIPLIYGGVNGWNGTAATFIPGRTCCLACLFPSTEIRKPEAGVPALGPVVGVIASIQSVEAVRILLGLTPGLANCLLEFQGNRLRFRTIHVEENPDCPCCGRSKGG